jgi:hypothetical protein
VEGIHNQFEWHGTTWKWDPNLVLDQTNSSFTLGVCHYVQHNGTVQS